MGFIIKHVGCVGFGVVEGDQSNFWRRFKPQKFGLMHNKPRQEKFLDLVYVISEAPSAVFRHRGRIHEILRKNPTIPLEDILK